MGEAYELKQQKEWERTRYLAYITRVSVINAMTGKQVFKTKNPAELFPLSIDKSRKRKVIKIDKDRQAKAVNKARSLIEQMINNK